MRLSDYDTSKRYAAAVLSNRRITPEHAADDVRELALRIDADDFEYKPGQNIGVIVPGPHALGHGEHFRLYTIADAPPAQGGGPHIDICVKRCHYIDEYSGEAYDGVASNYLCDRQPGDLITLCGPYGMAFDIPDNTSANVLMIGMGTGIAPFRAFVRYIYQQAGTWRGQVRLFYGARTGLEALYMNDEQDDFANYYDRPTFRAFKALSPRPGWGELPALDDTLLRERAEVWQLLCDPNTYVYVAGLAQVSEMLDNALANMAGSAEKWRRRKAELVAGGRWAELIY